ncbi:MAG: surface lipoprotein assembly modifier [Nevskiaceae bacterium]|nr:surface lipoprotein assembly modifier [Nevskiaceae bacterium]
MNAQRFSLRGASMGLGIALLTPCSTALAAQWTLTPQAQVGALAETNPRLFIGGGEDAQSLSAGGNLSLRRATELSTLEFDAKAEQRSYLNDNSLSHLDSDLAAQYQSKRERYDWNVRGFFVNDTTLTSELGLSGITTENRRHRSSGGAVNVNWLLTERFKASAGASAQFDQYPSSDLELTNYQYVSTQLGGIYALNQRSALSLTWHHGDMAVSGGGPRTSDSSLVAQYQFAASERLNLTVAAGPSWTKGPVETRSSEVFNVTLTRNTERFKTSLSGGRRVAPTARGYLTQRDQVSVNFSAMLTERLEGTATGAYVRSRDVLPGFNVNLVDVRYSRIAGNLRWKLRERLSLSTGVGYGRQEVGLDQRQKGSGYDVRLGLNWDGDPYVW